MHLAAEQLRDQLAPLFEEHFTRFGELGAAVSVWQNGESVLELQGGFRNAKRETPWTADTIVRSWLSVRSLACGAPASSAAGGGGDLEAEGRSFGKTVPSMMPLIVCEKVSTL